MFWIFFLLALLGLVIGSYTDFKTREVPDWFSYGLIFAGVFLHGVYSAVIWSWTPLLYSLFGLGIGIGIALAMFYLGQWGGGDSKMMMALGAIIGMEFSLDSFFLSFIVNVFFLGSLYGLFYGVVLAFKNRKEFKKEFSRIYHEKKNIFLRRILVIAAIILIIFSLFLPLSLKIYLIVLIMVIFASYLLYIFAKSIEKCCMLKKVNPSVLTEGDWIAKDVVVRKKRICGPKDLGISLEQIEKLKKLHVKEVLVKEGIPFVPSFLIAFLFSYFFGNVLFLLFVF